MAPKREASTMARSGSAIGLSKFMSLSHNVRKAQYRLAYKSNASSGRFALAAISLLASPAARCSSVVTMSLPKRMRPRKRSKNVSTAPRGCLEISRTIHLVALVSKNKLGWRSNSPVRKCKSSGQPPMWAASHGTVNRSSKRSSGRYCSSFVP